jgi:regulator of protease activity HflC (stomatin/prohibitin superfamily)
MMKPEHQLVLGIVVAIFAWPVFGLLLRMFRIEIEDGETALVTRFGRLAATLSRPGWHWLPDRALPWLRVTRVSTRRDFLEIGQVALNDARGTTVIVDVWLELRVADPVKATFDVDDWKESLHNLVSHAVISILGNRELREILCDRAQLGELLRRDIVTDTSRWGLEIGFVLIKNVGVLPEVAQQFSQTVAATLERAKADIEEEGRQQVALLQAETASRVAKLVAEARGQYPSAVGRAYAVLSERPEIFAAYQQLYELSMLRPDQIVAFKGFQDGELRPVDAAMLVPHHAAQ